MIAQNPIIRIASASVSSEPIVVAVAAADCDGVLVQQE